MFDLGGFIDYLKKAKIGGASQAAIGEMLGVPQGYVSQIAKNQRPFKKEYLDALRSKYGDTVNDFILPEDKSDTLVSELARQPILDIRVSAGHGIGLEGNEDLAIDWVSIPRFDGCYGIMVYGDSMYDRFKSGDIVFVRPIKSRTDFDFGQCYVIITSEDRYIKNIYESSKGEEYITMNSYNTEVNPDGKRRFPDRDIRIEEIKHLYKVAGKLRRDQL